MSVTYCERSIDQLHLVDIVPGTASVVIEPVERVTPLYNQCGHVVDAAFTSEC